MFFVWKSLSQKGPELPKALMDFIRNNNAAVSEISEKVTGHNSWLHSVHYNNHDTDMK